MHDRPNGDITAALLEWGRGNQAALGALMPQVYEELRRLARRTLRHERPDHTLQTTALVHEAYLRLVDQRQARVEHRAHFFAIAAQVMRRILVDHARRHDAVKRGGGAVKSELDVEAPAQSVPDLDLVALDQALDRLSAIDARQGRIVELRFFGGLTVEETAEALNVSPATVKNEWRWARTWLYTELYGDGE